MRMEYIADHDTSYVLMVANIKKKYIVHSLNNKLSQCLVITSVNGIDTSLMSNEELNLLLTILPDN